MNEKSVSYDWEAYYRAAYEKEKKHNTVTAGKIADAEARQEDAALKLERIHNNAFWKLSAPVRKCYHALAARKAKAEADTETAAALAEGITADFSNGKIPSGMCITEGNIEITNDIETLKQMKPYHREYAKEVFRQKHPYLQWIALHEKERMPENEKAGQNAENAGKDTAAAEAGMFVDGIRQIDIAGTDLCIIACGNGIISAKTCEKVKTWFNNNENNNCIFTYPDEDYYWENLSGRMHPWFKPDWSPDTLLSFCYAGHMIIVRKSLCGPLCEEFPTTDSLRTDNHADACAAAFYHLCLRLEECALEGHYTIGHIQEVLFHNRYEADERTRRELVKAGKEGRDVLEMVESLLEKELEQGRGMPGAGASCLSVREAALQRRGIAAHFETGQYPGIYHVVYEMPQRSMISVIIPSKDHPDVLEKCLSSFRERTEYDSYEWIVVDNGSNAENRKRMELLQKEYGFTYLYEPMEFNFSAMCNRGAARAQGEYLLLLNDDIEILHGNWLHIMAGQASLPHTGAVGAKLWYAEGSSIQHVGITNMRIGPSHKLITYPDDRNYYYGRNQVVYDMIGVTAACLMIEKRKYMEAGGMDETMKVAYNDVDFCFKLIEAGYYNVLRNDAVLYHAESLSRGLDEEDEGKWERLLCEKENLYAKHPTMEGRDIFYHNSLIDNASHYACDFKFDYERYLKTIEPFVENAGNLAGMTEGILQLTVDRAEKQHKIHREEADIMFLMGWSYIPGDDNAKYERNIVLAHESGACLRVCPYPWFRRDAVGVLSGQVNVSLSGFVARIKKEKLQSGVWRVGMTATDLDTHQSFLTWSDKKMVVK